ncbi:MFS transporter [Streptomyces anulatus]|uniref:MFS transporter n=1 Tax=Streptomyces anulatus TaxID=1892 RepID=UPI00324BD14B|nr:MFS transporter [Streptomyces anulatus]WSU32298.1 MFS transporter [Streptomyces anulatus]WSU88826.1 MFS transporter [Streptomyces anulatus]
MTNSPKRAEEPTVPSQQDLPADTAGTVVAREASGRNTAVLVGFTALSNLADGVMKIALPLVATSLTSSPALISGVMLTLSLPWLLTALHVGVLVDRYDRRKLVWAANGIQIVVVGVLVALAASDALSLPAIYVCGAVLGVAEVLAMTSAAALVPDVVAASGRERVNSWVAGAETVCQEFAGPFIGGLLVGVGASFALGATFVGYTLTAVILVFLVGRFRVAVAPDEVTPPVHAQISEGLRFLWQQQLLRVLALAVAVLGSCWGAWYAVMPLYATGPMGLSAADYGLLVGALGVGGILGTVVVGPFNRLFGRRWAMVCTVVLTSVLVVAPALTTQVWVVGGAAFLGGMGGTLWTINVRTVMQTLVPMQMMGRFGAVFRLFAFGAIPVGAGLSGLLAEWFSTPTALAVFAIGSLVVFVPLVRVFTPEAEADIVHRLQQP